MTIRIHSFCQTCHCEIKEGRGLYCYSCRSNQLDSLKQASRAMSLYRKCKRINPNCNIVTPMEFSENCEYYVNEYRKIMHNELIKDILDKDAFFIYYSYLYEIFRDYC